LENTLDKKIAKRPEQGELIDQNILKGMKSLQPYYNVLIIVQREILLFKLLRRLSRSPNWKTISPRRLPHALMQMMPKSRRFNKVASKDLLSALITIL
jgi:hypothetical protein